MAFDLESGKLEVVDDADAIMGQDDLDSYEFIALKNDSSGKAISMSSLDKQVPRDDVFLEEVKEALQQHQFNDVGAICEIADISYIKFIFDGSV